MQKVNKSEMLKEIEEKATHQMAIDLALTDLLFAATDFLKVRSDLPGFKVEQWDDEVWVILPDGCMHALPPDEHKD